MPDLKSIFDHWADFDPEGDFENWVAGVPGRWVVYLLADEGGRAIQLLCVKNLRASLRRRLGPRAEAGPSRKVDYRQVVRRVYWRRVDSALEADWRYLLAAREIFPESYRGMVGFHPAWFVHVDPDSEFPRFQKTIDLRNTAGLIIGPLEDKHAAARLIEHVEDALDLCRYYNVLVQAPRGKACAYKEMGKCPAPCDGSISMEEYRAMIRAGAEAMVDPAAAVSTQETRMAAAAAGLRFEEAGRCKAALEHLRQLGRGAFRYVRRIEDFRFVAVERGPRKGTAKILAIGAGGMEEVLGIIGDWGEMPNLAAPLVGRSLDADVVAVVTRHLFMRKDGGEIVHEGALSGLAKAVRRVRAEETVEEEGEGLMKELGECR